MRLPRSSCLNRSGCAPGQLTKLGLPTYSCIEQCRSVLRGPTPLPPLEIWRNRMRDAMRWTRRRAVLAVSSVAALFIGLGIALPMAAQAAEGCEVDYAVQ